MNEENYVLVSKIIHKKLNKSSENVIYQKIINNPDSINIDMVFISKNSAINFMEKDVMIDNKPYSLSSIVNYKIKLQDYHLLWSNFPICLFN